METFLRFASGGTSVEQYTREVHTKSQLTSAINAAVRSLQREFLLDNDSYAQRKGIPIVLAETSSPAVVDLCNALEACLLHGLKEKLSLSRVTNAVLGPKSPTFGESYSQDFWPIVLILCHNQVSESLMKLSNISTDIGRCRSWVRTMLSDALFGSYLEALVHDTSLLHGFYRSSAYIRDRDHMDLLRSVLEGLDNITFQLNYDCASLNAWSLETLQLVGVSVQPVPDPVMTAVDALDEVRKVELKQMRLKKKADHRERLSNMRVASAASVSNSDTSSIQSSVHSMSINSEPDVAPAAKAGPSTNQQTPQQPQRTRRRISHDLLTTTEVAATTSHLKLKIVNTAQRDGDQLVINGTSTPDIVITPTVSPTRPPTNDAVRRLNQVSSPSVAKSDTSSSVGGNSINRNKGWSTSPARPIGSRGHRGDGPFDHEASFESVLQSYSTEVVLSSTPDVSELNQSSVHAKLQALKQQGTSYKQFGSTTAAAAARQRSTVSGGTGTETMVSGMIADFEVIPKTMVLSYTDADSQEFLMQLCQLGNEVGLNQQDYKCNSCVRPIGMIYGPSRLDKYDGHNYCTDCHANDKMIIPARVLHNWDFKEYPVAKRTRHFLSQVEAEPLLDIKTSSPTLYKSVPELATCLDLRTQLFYLHAYIFTCAESVTLELRRILWPKEHLFEHIHLYSTQDLLQLSTGQLLQSMKKAIAFARRHVLNCQLCSQRGFICEICRDDTIIYPFDTAVNYRCEACKTVFHKKCVLDDRTGLRKMPCPRCIRIERRERAKHALDA